MKKNKNILSDDCEISEISTFSELGLNGPAVSDLETLEILYNSFLGVIQNKKITIEVIEINISFQLTVLIKLLENPSADYEELILNRLLASVRANKQY